MSLRLASTSAHHERIVFAFEHRFTEVRWSRICQQCRLTKEQFESAIATARDTGIAQGLWITPIYEREGWWTCEPTDRILVRAALETSKRNIGEAERNLRVAKARAIALGTDASDRIANGLALVEMSYKGGEASLRDQIPESHITEYADYVLARVDAAQAVDLDYVMRDALEAAA